VPDIPYIIGPITELYGGTLNTANVNISTTGDRDLAAARMAQNVLKSFRLIRLVRIVKLYKYLTKRESEE